MNKSLNKSIEQSAWRGAAGSPHSHDHNRTGEQTVDMTVMEEIAEVLQHMPHEHWQERLHDTCIVLILLACLLPCSESRWWTEGSKVFQRASKAVLGQEDGTSSQWRKEMYKNFPQLARTFHVPEMRERERECDAGFYLSVGCSKVITEKHWKKMN